MQRDRDALARARAELGYEPSVLPREGLQRTIQHFREDEMPEGSKPIVAAHER
jgi:nucleoside-diphosphate-sugar epimerase